ncbi:MAG: NADH:ubiquinone reductase (Na(+)-transporting) subunit C [Bacteroidales bacterium]|nr:NADH:ubiquinone reductase (Na(+)-transporting) subunit C [Bacteroidales bacterium]
MSTNSNAYTIIYSAVLVIIVAFLLSFVASSLKERQEANERNDKRAQILAAINILDGDVEANFGKYVKPFVVNANGDVVEGKDGFEIDFSKKATEQELPLYVCNVDGQTKYIVPVKGNGLWGPIWGYVGLNDDKSTVYGIYFNHEGETPGLGAEIVTDAFRGQFIDKHVKNDKGEVVSIAVLKKGIQAAGQEQVDAISGGTITSSGVDAMLQTSLKKYEKFLTK